MMTFLKPLGYAGAFALAAALGLSAATQFVAWKFGYQAALGEPLGFVGRMPWYAPWSIVGWLQWREEFAFINAGLFLGLIGVVIPFAGFVRLMQPPAADFGRKVWASAADLIRAGLLPRRFRPFEKSGTVLGKWHDGRILSYVGEEHQMVVGASRSGKTVGFVIPTLLSWRGSVVVFDPKRELYAITALFRQRFSQAFFIDFTDPSSASFNPLDEVRVGTVHDIADVQNIVAILVDPGGSKDSLDYWEKDSSELLLGVILHVLYGEDDSRKNLAAIRELLLDLPNLLKAMKDSHHPEVSRIGNNFQQMPEKQLYGVKATASTALIIYADPLVAEKTSRSDFSIASLVCLNTPLSLYIQLPPSDANRLRPLSRLLLSQIATLMMEDLEHVRGKKKQHKLMMMVDEFATLGRLDCFTSWIRVMASYGLQAVLILQSDRDLADTYGANNTISENCPIQVLFPTSDDMTLKRISTAIGNAEEARESRSYPRWYSPGRSSRSVSDRRRAVLEPGQIRAMSKDEQLILATTTKPIRCRKVRWWKDRPFRTRGVNTQSGSIGPRQNQAILKRIGEVKAQIPQSMDMSPGADSETPPTIEAVPTPVTSSKDIDMPASGGKRPQQLALPIPETQDNPLSAVVEAIGWKKTESARQLFPLESPHTVLRWISGARSLPDEHLTFINHLLDTVTRRHQSQAELQAWLLSADEDGAPVIERLRNGEVIETEVST